ncbi:hypothetical protein MTR_8g096750 [Medicago truncatula]|uniref:Uncharacterized protein n=1 Tax=Medicago truncatula TaxID=3880 RepID=A0A072TUB3_MEDTR|nr:hypothetical protein MTR_8g096750 [Medicago truncatula]
MVYELSESGKSSTHLNESPFVMLCNTKLKLVGLWTIIGTWNQNFFTSTGLKSILCDAAEDAKTKRIVSRNRKIVTIVSLFSRQVSLNRFVY